MWAAQPRPALPLRHAGVAALTKSIMPRGSNREELVKAAQVLKRWFGQNGGQPRPYSAELASRLRLAKAISLDEERRWKLYGRLPERIDVTTPGKNAEVDWRDAGTTRLMQGLAGMGPAPSAEALARRALR